MHQVVSSGVFAWASQRRQPAVGRKKASWWSNDGFMVRVMSARWTDVGGMRAMDERWRENPGVNEGRAMTSDAATGDALTMTTTTTLPLPPSASRDETQYSAMSDLSEKALVIALEEARKKGLPEGWTVKLDVRHDSNFWVLLFLNALPCSLTHTSLLQKRRRRKWISPTGKSCDSIPKAIAISIELGMLPPDTPIPKSNAGRPKKRKADGPTPPRGRPPKAKTKVTERPSTPDAVPLEYDSDEEDPGPDSDPETSLDVPIRADPNSTRPTTVHWDPHSPDGAKVGWNVRLWDENDNEWRDGRIILYDPYTHKHKVKYDTKPRKDESVDSQNCVWVRLINEVRLPGWMGHGLFASGCDL